MPDYNTQVHGTPAAVVRDPKTIRRRHWALVWWSMLIWTLALVCGFIAMDVGVAVGLALLGLATVFLAAWLMEISLSPLRRNLYAFAYFCLTCGPGTGWLYYFGATIMDPELLLVYVALLMLPGLVAFGMSSIWPLFIPALGLVCWLVAKYKIPEPEPTTPSPMEIANV